jgi:hypothetical protein
MRPQDGSSLICVNAIFQLKLGNLLDVHLPPPQRWPIVVIVAGGPGFTGARSTVPAFRIAVLLQINSSLIARDRFALAGKPADSPTLEQYSKSGRDP